MLAYGASYLLGSAVSYVDAPRGGSAGSRPPHLVRFLVRLLIAAVVSTGGRRGRSAHVLPGRGDDVSHVLAGVRLVVLGVVDVVLFVALARLMRIREVTTVLETVVRRLPRPARAS